MFPLAQHLKRVHWITTNGNILESQRCRPKPKNLTQNMTQLNAERRPAPRRATSEAMWDKTDIWVKCHITEVVLLCDNISRCCVGSLSLLTSGLGLGLRLCRSYQHVDSAAHAVFLVLVVHDGPVVQQPLQQTHHQSDEVLARLGQVHVLPAVLQQTGFEQKERKFLHPRYKSFFFPCFKLRPRPTVLKTGIAQTRCGGESCGRRHPASILGSAMSQLALSNVRQPSA